MKNKVLALFIFAFTMINMPFSVTCVKAEGTEKICLNKANEGIYLRTDVIVKKTRIYRGKLQYRHWNETRGHWVESKWTNA